MSRFQKISDPYHSLGNWEGLRRMSPNRPKKTPPLRQRAGTAFGFLACLSLYPPRSPPPFPSPQPHAIKPHPVLPVGAFCRLSSKEFFMPSPQTPHVPHELHCPCCHSTHLVQRATARRVGGVLGAAAGTAGGIASAGAGAATGARLGSLVGLIAGPLGAPISGLAGALLGGLIGGATGGLAGAQLGDVIDRKVLDNVECVACGHTFQSDEPVSESL